MSKNLPCMASSYVWRRMYLILDTRYLAPGIFTHIHWDEPRVAGFLFCRYEALTRSFRHAQHQSNGVLRISRRSQVSAPSARDVSCACSALQSAPSESLGFASRKCERYGRCHSVNDE